jgi:Putative Actinobacterial Holin-X, holin superfamily III
VTAPMADGYSASGSTSTTGETGGATAAGTGAGGSGDVSDVSVGQLLGAVTEDLSTLMRQELALAKAELTVEAKKAGQAAGMFGGAGFAGYLAVLFVSIAAWQFLDKVMPSGWAALIVAVVWAVIGAVLFARGRAQARDINPTPERTVETAKKVPDALKPSTPSNAKETR